MKYLPLTTIIARRRISNIDGQDKAKKSGSAGRMLARRKTALALQEDDKESESNSTKGPTVSPANVC